LFFKTSLIGDGEMQVLDHIKVLDLTTFPTGSLAVMFLVDMGADAIKIQQPQPRFKQEGAKADSNAISEAEEERRREIAAAYQFDERGKKSICLNLKTQQGKDIFYKLAKTADVVIDEFRPGVTERLGIDYDTLKAINPRIICCSVTGYGHDGPYRLYPGHDTNFISIAGILGITGTPDGRHAIPGIPIGDLAGGGMQAAIGILMALIAREKTGKGQFVDTSMVDALVLFMMIRHGPQFFTTGRQPQLGERPALVFETKDGKYINIAPGEPWFWERLCRALGLEEFLPYQRAVGVYAPDAQEMIEKREQIITSFQEVFRTKTRDEWLRILWEADTCVGPVYKFDEILSDPHLLHRRMITEVDHPNLGKIKQPGIIIKLSETPGKIRGVSPITGQHTEEILKSLDYSEKDIAELRKAGVIN
jgi:crotonobetainyl-CoA:carnitine CoA-transferase CaiB-like acyl-CoA transferase